MISMNNWATQALNKLQEGKKNVTGQKEKAMAAAVAAQLESFCKESTEFARAVATGGTFSECMKKVAAGVGQHISDIDAYKKAVQFYFPGAEVKMKMTIDLAEKEVGEEQLQEETARATQEEKTKIISLNLSDFF